MRIVEVAPHAAHMHRGGAEISASRLANALRLRGHEVFELAASPSAEPSQGILTALSHWQFIVPPGYSDGLRFTSSRSPWADTQLGNWLARIDPDVVHIHHFVGVGSDLIFLIRRAVPRARIVFTLHEMLVMCARDGKMAKSDWQLCNKASAYECGTCVGESPASIFLREDYFRRMLDAVDVVTAPSDFVADRVESWWGRGNVIMMPNCPPEELVHSSMTRVESPRCDRFGFFGQIIPAKGLDILLDALLAMNAQDEGLRLTLAIHGTRPDDEYWQTEIEPRLLGLQGERATATYAGPYHPESATRLMMECDWICVPSRWWENAPTVIFEAAAAARPVITHDFGGMAEAARKVGGSKLISDASPTLWASTLAALIRSSDQEIWQSEIANIEVPWTVNAVVTAYVSAFKRVEKT